MSWLKLDDGFGDHPKVLELSDAAFRLHVRALCWCARQETDGVITRGAQRALASTPKLTKELEASGLWAPATDGHEIHDYLKYNPSRAKLESEREGTRSRVARSRTPNVTPHVTALHDPLVTPDVTPHVTAVVTPIVTASVRPSRPVPSRSGSDLTTTVSRPESLTREEPSDPGAAVVMAGKISCPSDLQLLKPQSDSLEMSPGVPTWAQRQIRDEFVAAELGRTSKTMPLEAWRVCLSKAICSRWNDSGRRPKPPVADPESGTHPRLINGLVDRTDEANAALVEAFGPSGGHR